MKFAENLQIKNKFAKIWPLSIFMFFFYITDALRLYIEHVSNFTIDRLFTWVLPTFLFIIFVLKKNPLVYLKLTNIKNGLIWGFIVSAIHAFLYCLIKYLWNGNLNIIFCPNFQTFWNAILTVGLVEEIVFRGLVLQNLNEVFSFRTANIISSVLFVLAHIPYWFFCKQFSLPLINIIYDFFYVFVFGIFWGFMLKKTNSLWAPIIHHSVNNFLALIIH